MIIFGNNAEEYSFMVNMQVLLSITVVPGKEGEGNFINWVYLSVRAHN